MHSFKVKLLNIIFICIGLSYGLDHTGSETSKNLNQVAKNILGEIFAARHKPLMDSLSSSDTIKAVDTMRTELIEQQKKTLKETPGLTKKEKTAIQTKLDKLEALSTDDYLNKIKAQVGGESGMDTISVRLNPQEKFSVAGNLKTRTLPTDLGAADPQLFELLATKPGRKANIPFGQADLGLQAKDRPAIQKAVTDAIDKKLIPGDLEKVYIIKPNVDPNMEEGLKTAFESEKKNLETLKNKELDQVQKRKDKTGIEKAKTEINEKYKTKVDDLKGRFDMITERVYHAETQHVLESYTDKNKLLLDMSGATSDIGTSKPLCAHCEGYVKQHETIKFVQEAAGLEANGVKNWAQTNAVEVEKMYLNGDVDSGPPKKYVLSKSDKPGNWWDVEVEKVDGKEVSKSVGAAPEEAASSTSKIKPGESCPSGGRRRKRAAGSSCIFRTRREDPGKVGEIDSEQFMKKYKDSGKDDRIRLSQIAEESGKPRIAGKVGDVDAVETVVKHEKLKKHNKQLADAADSLKTGDFDGVSGKGTKLSPKTVRFQMSKKLQKFTKNAGKVSGTLGKFLLAKGIVQGIASGDTTTLAIMGGRIGGEIALEVGGKLLAKVATKVGAKAGTKLGIKATAKLASKSFKFLSKAAGPIGAIADIGLSAWQLSSAIKRLNNPNATKWEQNEAIADIVGESLDIAITAITTIASIAFPPLAPLFAVVGFFASLFVTAAVTIYKAQNHVDMLNSKIELLDFEKDTEFGRHLIGKETSAYITNLIETKFANNLAVNASIQFLEKNPDVIGHVFPGRTMEVEGGCQVEKSVCHFDLFGCWGRGSAEVLDRNCFKDGECPNSSYRCESSTEAYYEVVRVWTSDIECKCTRSDRTSFGDPILNQVVDFRNKQWLYLDRAVPDPPYDYNYEELCRPSSLQSKGHRISQSSKTLEFECEGAIGIKRRSGTGKYMLFELEDGNDKVYIREDDSTSNRFLVGNGRKEFRSGAGNDIFVMTGSCGSFSGILDGGRGDDVIAFGDECGTGKRLDIDMVEGLSVEGSWNRMEVTSVENVYGREKRGDDLKASCETKYIAGGGGSGYGDRDKVTTARQTCESWSEKVTIMANSFTSVETEYAFKEAVVVIPSDATNVEVSGGNGRTAVYIQKGGAENLSSARLSSSMALALSFGGRNVLQARNASTLAILLEERESNPTQIVESGESVVCLHKLDSEHRRRHRNGCPSVGNVFELMEGSYWNVKGGRQVDIFILSRNNFQGKIFGGLGMDELQIGALYEGTVRIDAKTGRIFNGESGENIPVRFEGVEKFVGRKERREIFNCSSTTAFVSGKGGESATLPDEIFLEKRNGVNLTILIEGHTRISSESVEGGLLNIILSPEKSTETKLELALPKALQVFVHFPFPIHQLSNVSFDSLKRLKIESVKRSSQSHKIFLDLKFPTQDNASKDVESNEHLSNLGMNFEEDVGVPSTLLVPNYKTSSNTDLLAFHTITSVPSVSEGKRQGLLIVSNYFRIRGGTTTWSLVGGEKDDVFELQVPFASGSISAGGGVNDLRLTVSETQRNFAKSINIDMQNGVISGAKENGGGNIKVSGIHRIFGAEGLRETIKATCITQFISCGGPTDSLRDKITFVENCREQSPNSMVQFVFIGYATISLGGNRRSILLQVSPFPSTGKVDFVLESVVSASSKKDVLLNLHPRDLKRYEYSYNSTQMKYLVTLDFGTDMRIRLALSREHIPRKDTNLQGINLIFTGQKGFDAVLLINQNSGRPLAFLQVQAGSLSVGPVEGASGMTNHFNLKSGKDVHVKGGSEDDHFNLHVGHITGSIDGGSGTNSLAILTSDNQNGIVTVDLQHATITLKNNGASVRIKDIQNIMGQSGKDDEVYVKCDTQIVRLDGGTRTSWDTVRARNTLKCTRDLQPVIFVPAYTLVENMYQGDGTFTYVVEVEQEFAVRTMASRKTKHVYRFQYDLAVIISTQFNQSNKELQLNLRSQNNLTIPIEEGRTEVILEKGNDRSDFHVDRSRVLVSSLIKDGAPNKFVRGITGAHNHFHLKVGSEGVLGSIRGSEKDDTFNLHTFHFIDSINGAGGNRNQLQLESNLLSNFKSELVFDLLSNSTQGAIRFKSGNSTLVREVRNIQILTGRGSHFNDQAFLDCNILLVSGVQHVVVTETECPQNQITVIEIDHTTTVSFLLPQGDSPFPATVFRNATFHYKFNVLRSFRIQTEFLMDIRLTTHVFHLAFTLDQLEGIRFSLEEGELIYKVAGEEYFHPVDTFLLWNDEFFSSPKFETRDDIQIKVNRHGEVFLTGMLSPWLPSEDDEMAEKFLLLSNKLKATFIVNGGVKVTESLLYFGHNLTTNVLTNTDARSLLSGGGSNSTTYVITDLQEDVKIYPGFHFSWNDSKSEVIHTVDLTHVIFPIRALSENGSKYVPRVVETEEGHMEIEMTGYLSQFPGKVVLVKGTQYASQIHVLLDAVVMTLEQVEGKGRQRRSTNREWKLVPKPLVLSGDTPVAVMSLEDFEFGQQIIYNGESVEDLNDTINGNKSSTYPLDSVRNNSDVVLTNLGGISKGAGASLRSLIILNGTEREEGDNFTRFLAESIQIVSGEQVTLDESVNTSVSLFELMRDAEVERKGEDLEDTLNMAEAKLLEGFPEVPRKFKIPLTKKVWKHYRLVVISLAILLLVVFVILTFLVCWRTKPWKALCFAWKYKFVVDKIKSKTEKWETNQIVLKDVCRKASMNQTEVQSLQTGFSSAHSTDDSDEYEEDACSIVSDYDLYFMRNDKF